MTWPAPRCRAAAIGGQPDRPGTEDDDGVAGSDTGQVAAMDTHRDGFAQRPLLICDVVGQRMCEVGPDDRVLRHGTLHRGRRIERDVGAQVVATHLAHRASAAGDAGFECDAGTRRQAADRRSDRHHVAGELMADDHGFLHHVPADAPVDEVVDVRGADAAGPDADQRVLRSHLRHRHLLDTKVVGRVQHDGLHGARDHRSAPRATVVVADRGVPGTIWIFMPSPRRRTSRASGKSSTANAWVAMRRASMAPAAIAWSAGS